MLIYFQNSFKLSRLNLLNQESLASIDNVPSSWYMCIIIEITLTAIVTPPYFDYTFNGYMLHGNYTYSYDSIIAIITLTRIWFTLKIYPYVVIWMRSNTIKLGNKFNCKPDVWFCIKANLKSRPIYLIVTVICLIVFTTGYAIHNLEKSFIFIDKCSVDLTDILNGFWLGVITLTTVGYGDAYPSTHIGRLLMVLTAIISFIFISLYLLTLHRASTFDNNQYRAHYMIKSFRNKENLKKQAADIIKNAFKLKKKLLDKSSIYEVFFFFKTYQHSINKFSSNIEKKTRTYMPSQQIFVLMQSKITEELDNYKKECINIKYIGSRLKKLIRNQKRISRNMDSIFYDISMIEETVENEIVPYFE